MLLILGAIVVGILIGLAFGGSLRTFAEIHLRWWPLALVGLALQLVPIPHLGGQWDRRLSVTLLIASYAVLLIFVVLNIRVTGFPLMAAGFALNLLAVSVNGGMPVGEQALRRTYGDGYEQERRDLIENGSAKHHLQRPDDVLIPLTDVIPIGGPTPQVVSVGDLVFLLGTSWVIAAATRGGAGRHRPGATRRLGESPDPESPASLDGSSRSD